MLNRITSLLFAVALLALPACAEQLGESGEPARGPLGKSDAPGSCSIDDCGGQSPDGCWCDDACVGYGDCCSDVETVCAMPPKQACGGLIGAICGPDEYCHYAEDQMCGAADQMGTCEPTPEACIEIFAPVCGCDGQTYSNSCFAHGAGTSVAHIGACEGQGEFQVCGGEAGLECADGLYCHYDEADMCGGADQVGECRTPPEACIEIFAPVCGCDGQTYENFCFANAAGTSVAQSGACGGAGEGEACGGFLGAVCGDGLFCNYAEADICGAADAQGTCEVVPEACIQIFDPVCGCDGQTYSNSCMANASGVAVQHQGSCN